VECICTEFFTGTKNDGSQAILLSKFISHKIQDGDSRHFEIHFYDHNSVADSLLYIFTPDLAQRRPKNGFTSPDITSENIQDGGDRHFDIRFNDYNMVHIAKTGTDEFGLNNNVLER